MRLPIPVFEPAKGGEPRIWTGAELRAPTPAAIANTQEAVQKGLYRGVIAFLTGCITAFTMDDGTVENDRNRISALVRRLPYASAEPLAIYALLEGDADDGIEGVYDCPRCGKGKVVCEYVSEEEDTRDHVRALAIKCQGGEDPIADRKSV